MALSRVEIYRERERSAQWVRLDIVKFGASFCKMGKRPADFCFQPSLALVSRGNAPTTWASSCSPILRLDGSVDVFWEFFSNPKASMIRTVHL